MDNPSTPQNAGEHQQFSPGSFPPGHAGIPPYPAYFAPPIQQLRIGFGKRLAAWLIDVVISCLVSGILAFLLRDSEIGFIKKAVGEAVEKTSGIADNPLGPEFVQLMAVFGVIATIFGLIYYSVELFTGATPAKHMLGMQVAYDDGRKGDLSLWAKRWFIKESGAILSFIALFSDIGGITLIATLLAWIIILGSLAAIGEERKALHDYLAGSAVFHTDDLERTSQTVT